MPKWVDDSRLQEANSIKIAMGYHNHLETLFSGEITGLEPDFPEKGTPTLTVRAYDRRHRLMRKRKTLSFTNLKDSDIASKLGRESGLKPEVEDSKVVLSYVLQHNQTDLDFLTSRARRIDYEVVVEDRALYFRHRKIEQDAALSLRLNIELVEFHPRLTTMGQVEEFIVHGWNPKDKKEIVARSGAGSEPTKMGGIDSGPTIVQQRFANTGSARVTMPVQSQKEADQMAKQGFSEMALGYIRAEGVCIGDPRLRAGMVVKVEGAGKRFSGLYYLCSTEHRFSMGKGYRTSFSARRNAT
jgi:phage protein D